MAAMNAMEKERPIETSEDWQRFLRERKRAEYAPSNQGVITFILVWCIGMLVAHLRGAF